MAPTKNICNESNNNNGSANSNRENNSSRGAIPKMALNDNGNNASSSKKSSKHLQQKQHHAVQLQQQATTQNQVKKNTEVVAPQVRRDLKEWNEYLLSTVIVNNNTNQSVKPQSSAAATASATAKLKQPNCNNNFNKKSQQQTDSCSSSTSAANVNANSVFDFETLPDNTRFCYPVRPIPRINSQQQQQIENYIGNNYSSILSTTNLNNLSSNLVNHAATIGVVIPTTPALANSNSSNSNSNTSNCSSNSSLQQDVTANPDTHSIPAEHSAPILVPEVRQQQLQQDLLLVQKLFDDLGSVSEQQVPATAATVNQQQPIQSTETSDRLQLYHQLMNFIAKVVNTNINSQPHVGTQFPVFVPYEAAATPTAANISDNTVVRKNTNRLSSSSTNMVHEITPTASANEMIVNSASLEDVPLSEASSNRAQSIQSLHSMLETPTPDATPSYEDLQQRLEASNRNIQNMQEQQQQLLQLQNAAKQHLKEMEQLRQHAGQLSFNASASNGEANADTPEYESIDQVHNDMSSLVGRMKNLTTFIQNQNELSNLLGDDGPEILAEQQALQRKLESLRTQREEMRNLVQELQDINRSAEESCAAQRDEADEEDSIAEKQDIEEKETPAQVTDLLQSKKHSNNVERVVPVEYARNVPIELTGKRAANAAAAVPAVEEINAEADPATAALIQQKVADIEAMKSQLKRLKDMMETVSLIEERTAGTAPKDVGRESTPIAIPIQRIHHIEPEQNLDDIDPNMARKVRMINEVTTDLRAQAASLTAERDRIKALKDEIVRRKEQAAAAAQMGEDALQRHSLTPTPTPLSRLQRETAESLAERDQLKIEYEAKKKEFELICKRLQSEDDTDSCTNQRSKAADQTTRVPHSDIMSEADDEADEEVIDSDFGSASAATAKYYGGSSISNANSARAQHMLNTNNISNSTNTDGKSSLNSTLNSASMGVLGNRAAVHHHQHDVSTNLEAASMQSDSSRSFSIPPPMANINAANWAPSMMTAAPPISQNSWQMYYGNAGTSSAPFTPPHFNMPSGGVSVASAVPAANVGSNSAQHSSSECICAAGANVAAVAAANAAAAATTTNSTTAAQLSADPVLMQQFVQTQQMLINSVGQCNQMLWHQQREIDNLNNTIHVLQDRLLTLTGPLSADLAFNIRSESVPPLNLNASSISNNTSSLYAASSINRAQSEQPLNAAFLSATPRAGGSAFANYQQQQQLHQQQQHHLYQQRQRSVNTAAAVGSFNYSSAESQQQQNVASNSIYTTLNNETTPQSPLSGGPGPIFMHHHNNAIHQNNANLRTQNHYANNNVAGNTLNNQVPPGNRANNYWDNFRSYSRQNLLSTNSNKSNEEQRQPHLLTQSDFNAQQQTALNHRRRQQQQEQLQANTAAMFEATQQQHRQNIVNNNCNLNGNNFMRSLQQQRGINRGIQHALHAADNFPQSSSNVQQHFGQTTNSACAAYVDNLNWTQSNEHEPLFASAQDGGFNIINDQVGVYMNGGGSMSLPVSSPSNVSNIRNMNLNIGNSPQYQRNKLPMKISCNTATSINNNRQQDMQPPHNFWQFPQPQQQSEQQYNAGNAMDEDIYMNQRNFGPQLNNLVDADDGNENNMSFVYCSSELNAAAATGSSCSNMRLENDNTSEEIKRNLLVNALKNDKFTTKFYESIKEDVFRRLESMLLDKENNPAAAANSSKSKQQQKPNLAHLQMQFNEIAEPTAAAAAEATSSNINTPEEDYQAEDDQATAQQQHHNNVNAETESNFDMADATNAAAESTTAGNEATLGASGEQLKSEHSHDNDSLCSWRCVASGNRREVVMQSSEEEIISKTPNYAEPQEDDGLIEAKHADADQQQCKRQTEQLKLQLSPSAESTENLPSGSSNLSLPNSSSSRFVVPTSPDYDLIGNIIQRIRNQTHANTIINDALLVEIAKLTANSAQNAAAANYVACNKATNAAAAAGGNSSVLLKISANISPKKIYAKIKKIGIPRERDEFLRWYQKYLETLLLIEQHVPNVGCKQQHELANRMLQKSNNNKINQDEMLPMPKPNNNEHLGSSNQVNDEDLAEADQVGCSPNNSKNVAETINEKLDENAKQILEQTNDEKTAQHELENNENPEQEQQQQHNAQLNKSCNNQKDN